MDISYTLLLEGTPASAELLAAIQRLEVEDHADLADILRLQLAIGVQEGDTGWTVLDEGIFSRLSKIKVLVTVGSAPPEPLIEAYVIESRVAFAAEPGQSVCTVAALDSTVLMNLEEKVRAWPNMADSDIATSIFGDYGFSPQVKATQPTRQEADGITMQRGTEIQFLRYLAQRNGYECYVELNPATGMVEGHFHPPQVDQQPQGVLSVNMGEATNVNSFSGRYDMLRPVTAEVTGLDVPTQSDQQAQITSLSLKELGQDPALTGNRPRRILLSKMGLSETGELQTYAQGVVDRSSWAIVVEGELNTVAYGGILRAKRPVLARGAGRQFSGTYYVERVLHTFSGQGYTQQFTLRRNALGLTGQETFVADGALSL